MRIIVFINLRQNESMLNYYKMVYLLLLHGSHEKYVERLFGKYVECFLDD